MSRRIEFKDIEDINKLKSGAFTIHFKNGRAPICIRDKERGEDIVQKLRAYRRTESDPGKRIIQGVDGIGEDGFWSLDRENEAIKKTLTLREARKWRDLGENELNFLSKLVDLNDYSDAITEGLKLKYKALVDSIQSSSEVIESEQFTVEELDTLKSMLKIMNELFETSRRFGTATLKILNKNFQDYSPKEEFNEQN